MGLYRYGGRIILFVHIPKTGGSTIETAMLEAGAIEALCSRDKTEYLAATPQHMHASVYQRLIPRAFYDYGFTVVRNPYTRLASEYHWRREINKLDKPFDDWLASELETAARKPHHLDNHLRPQVDFLSDDIDVFRFEDGLWGPVRSAFSKLQIEATPENLPHVRRGPGHLIPTSPGTIQLIRSQYARDFRELGYDAERLPREFVADVGGIGSFE